MAGKMHRVSDHKELKALRAKRQELKSKLGDVERRLEAGPPKDVRAEATRLLEGDQPDRPSPHEQYELLKREAAVVREALLLLGEDIDRLQGELSVQVINEARPQFTAVAAEIANGLKELTKSLHAERELRRRLIDAGVYSDAALPGIAISPLSELDVDRFGSPGHTLLRRIVTAYNL